MIGGDTPSADIGAQLILSGLKKTTSGLPSDFDGPGQRPPRPGDLSLVLDGRGDPVCIVRTASVKTQPFRDVDEAFALDYGEWDGTLATWRDRMLAYYSDQLVEDPLDTLLVCKRFTRVGRGQPESIKTSLPWRLGSVVRYSPSRLRKVANRICFEHAEVTGRRSVAHRHCRLSGNRTGPFELPDWGRLSAVCWQQLERPVSGRQSLPERPRWGREADWTNFA